MFYTVTVGCDGVAFGAAFPLPSALSHPFTICFTVNVPAVDTVIDIDVAPVLHNRDPL